MPAERTRDCLECLARTRDVKGDVLELGVGDGDNALHLAQWLAANTRKFLFALDCWRGLPHEPGAHDGDLKRGECHHSLLDFIDRARPYANLYPVPGLIEDTLPQLLAGQSFSFAFVDLDLYESTRFAVEWLNRAIEPGGIIGFHDFGFERFPGVARALEFLDHRLFDRLPMTWLDPTNIFFRRLPP